MDLYVFFFLFDTQEEPFSTIRFGVWRHGNGEQELELAGKEMNDMIFQTDSWIDR